MALTLLQYEEVVGLLGRTVPLVDLLESRGSGYSDEVLRWLKDVETSLVGCRVPAVSRVAACRAALLGAARGVHVPEVVIAGRPTQRKVRDATASLVLRQCVDLLQDVIAERRATFEEAERIAGQVVAVVQLRGWLGGTFSQGRQRGLEALLARMASDADLANAHARLLAIVGRSDVLILLDRALAKVE